MGVDTLYGPSSMSSGSALAADANALGKLKMQAGNQTAESIQETAKQFESLFMRELLKSMREANNTVKSGMESGQHKCAGQLILRVPAKRGKAKKPNSHDRGIQRCTPSMRPNQRQSSLRSDAEQASGLNET